MNGSLFVDHLTTFGLTRQEALIYHCLLTDGKLTGYEIAKKTGISRSNVYNTVDSLVEKGAAYVSLEPAKKYTPVLLEEFCDNRIRNLLSEKEWLQSNSPQIKKEEEGYITIEGMQHIEDKIKSLLTGAQERVYLSCTRDCISVFEGELYLLTQKKKKIVIVTDAAFEMGGVVVHVSDKKGCQIGVITDSKYVLTGEYGRNSQNNCLYSGQKNFVELFKNALANEIELIGYKKGEHVL